MIPKDILEIAKHEGKDFRFDKNHPESIISGMRNKIDEKILWEIAKLGYVVYEQICTSYEYPHYYYQFASKK
jgi:hypothetical protein